MGDESNAETISMAALKLFNSLHFKANLIKNDRIFERTFASVSVAMVPATQWCMVLNLCIIRKILGDVTSFSFLLHASHKNSLG